MWRQVHAVPYLHTRLTADYCTVAIVSARGDWAPRLNDTIDYLRSACDGPTTVRTVGWTVVDVRPYPTDTSPSWAEQRLADRIERECTAEYKACPYLPPRPHVAPTPSTATLNSAPPLPPANARAQIPRALPGLRPSLLDRPLARRAAMRRVRQALPLAGMGTHSGTGGLAP